MTHIEQIKIAEQNRGYDKWIKEGSTRLKEMLPFEGSAHLAVTIGSAGMGSLVSKLRFAEKPVVIPFEEIGLPIGENPNHPKSMVAGITESGKKVIIVMGRTHEYEVKPSGITTKSWGILTPAELTTGYLGMLNEVGVENMILTNASGAINHPLRRGEDKPYKEEDIPVVAVIGSDIDLAYSNANMGRYKGRVGDFFSLRDSDPVLAELFGKSWQKFSKNKQTPPTIHYVTSPSTPSFEDPAIIKLVAELGGQAVGMSYSPEKQFLSGLNGIKRFLGVTIMTNIQELVLKGHENDDMAISVEELRYLYPHQLDKKFAASDEEVRINAKRVQEELSAAIAELTHIV